MTQMQMNKLFNVDTRTLRNWKNGNRKELYNLLEALDLESAKKLLVQSDKSTYGGHNRKRKLLYGRN